MRIRLLPGKQKELVGLAKSDKTWSKLAEQLGLSVHYTGNELRNEKVLLSEASYNKLCRIANIDFGRYITEKLNDNWGRVKGAFNSSRNIKQFKEPEESERLSELFGTILGDGNINQFKKGKKIRCYILRIAGDSRNDKEYLSHYVSNLFFDLLGEKGSIMKSRNRNAIYLSVYGKNLVNFLKKKGLESGNKKQNNQGIPEWIQTNQDYLRTCIRGLIDTDGSIHYISKNNKNLRISFVSHIPKLLGDVRNSFIKLGFNPSKIIRERQIFLSRKADIQKYTQEIGFSNSKHLKRLRTFQNQAPVV